MIRRNLSASLPLNQFFKVMAKGLFMSTSHPYDFAHTHTQSRLDTVQFEMSCVVADQSSQIYSLLQCKGGLSIGLVAVPSIKQ